MDDVKQDLLNERYPDTLPSEIHCGYHRGRRQIIGGIVLPDVVSIHHLHLHVIVRPRLMLWFFKYPFWLLAMWVSDEKLMRRLKGRKMPRMAGSSN